MHATIQKPIEEINTYIKPGERVFVVGCNNCAWKCHSGGETVSDSEINEYCSLCGECIIEFTGGLCPMTLCAKGLLNGTCGGAEKGKCEVDPDRDCGWVMIYERLKKLGRLDLLGPYQNPKNNAKWSRPRNLRVSPHEAVFCSMAGRVAVSNQD